MMMYMNKWQVLKSGARMAYLEVGICFIAGPAALKGRTVAWRHQFISSKVKLSVHSP
jgi:hypothetical protein